ncbi:hypothetical protein FQN57_000785 [Myotisia sp. PD_48]|nr:hypothetical protein FQN57_000785 [Myotisia sp. PD_48]
MFKRLGGRTSITPNLILSHIRTNLSRISSNASRIQPRRLITTIVEPAAQSKWPRRFRIAGYILIFGGLGSINASMVMKQFGGPVLEPDSPEDIIVRDTLKLGFDRLPLVKKLRADPDYVEWEPYGHLNAEEKLKRITSGSLRGSRGVSCQRIFYNEKENTFTTVLFVGNGIEGWPTIVHGGALGIILDENMGRVAIRNFPAKTGVTANLNINYKAPVLAGQYISIESKYNSILSSERKAFVEGVIKDQHGRVCTHATGLFVQPKKLQLKRIGDQF